MPFGTKKGETMGAKRAAMLAAMFLTGCAQSTNLICISGSGCTEYVAGISDADANGATLTWALRSGSVSLPSTS